MAIAGTTSMASPAAFTRGSHAQAPGCLAKVIQFDAVAMRWKRFFLHLKPVAAFAVEFADRAAGSDSRWRRTLKTWYSSLRGGAEEAQFRGERGHRVSEHRWAAYRPPRVVVAWRWGLRSIRSLVASSSAVRRSAPCRSTCCTAEVRQEP